MKDYIFITWNKTLTKLFLTDILFVKSKGDYIQITDVYEKKYTIHHTMKSIEDLLGDKFCRIHNETIVQLREINKVEDNVVYLSNGAYFPISRFKKQEFLNQLTII